MKLLFKLEFVIIGYGFVLNEYIVQCLESIFQRSGICSFLKNFIRSLVEKYGKHTVYTDGSTWDGIQRHVINWDSNTNYIILYRKVWYKSQSILQRENQEFLMITLRLLENILTYYINMNGQNSLYLWKKNTQSNK